ncbi:NADH-quinone oxidoreductase subunit C [bacterium]|nr:MAG: NADH-quinone oxidoreductase subunit C [bacterium]
MTSPKVELQSLPSASAWTQEHGVWFISLPGEIILAVVSQLLSQQARLMGITGQALGEETQLSYHFAYADEVCTIKVLTHQQHIPSITPITVAADWAECEAHDLFNVIFDGHPALRRLVRPSQLEAGLFRQPGGAASKSEAA